MTQRRSPHSDFLRPALLAAGLILLLLLPGTAFAHTEGVMQLASEPAGPYKLTVWTSPDPATTGEELHVAMAVVLAEDASPVLEADIQVRLTPVDGGPVISGAATIENSENKFLHEAILQVETQGDYLVAISVTGADGGSGQASFPLAVEGGGGLNWTLIVLVAIVVAAVALLVVRRLRGPVDEARSGK
jgi:hypothetical protein